MRKKSKKSRDNNPVMVRFVSQNIEASFIDISKNAIQTHKTSDGGNTWKLTGERRIKNLKAQKHIVR